jgi:hypothetical protein
MKSITVIFEQNAVNTKELYHSVAATTGRQWYGAIFSSSHILKDGTPGISIEWTHKVAPPPWLLGSDRPSPKGAVRSRG